MLEHVVSNEKYVEHATYLRNHIKLFAYSMVMVGALVQGNHNQMVWFSEGKFLYTYGFYEMMQSTTGAATAQWEKISKNYHRN